MKRLVYPIRFLIFFIPVLFTSCEKEKPLSETMIGKWDAEYVIRFIYENNVLREESKIYLDAGTIMLEFVAGGNGIYSDPNDDYLFHWTLSGTSLTIEDLSEEPLVWELYMDGDKLVWSWPLETDEENATITYRDVFTAKRIK